MPAEAGISTLGVKFGYGVGTLEQKPTTFTQVERVNSIGGISLSTEQIDASALEDKVSKYVAGRQDTGGTWEVTYNISDEVVGQLNAMIEEYKGLSGDKKMWFTVWSPYMENAFYVIAQVPETIGMPEVGQNALQTVAMTFTIEEYKGLDTAIEPKVSGEGA
jgi:hypothetical protein